MSSRHYGHLPPGDPRGDLEEIDPNYAIWWYTQRSEKRWAFALRAEPYGPERIYEVSRSVGGFMTREEANRAGNIAACARAVSKRSTAFGP